MASKDDDVFVLKGELQNKLDQTKSYFATRIAITEKLLNYVMEKEVNEGETVKRLLFLHVGNCEIEDRTFTIPVKIDQNAFLKAEGKEREKE